jgi:hypothetical protein
MGVLSTMTVWPTFTVVELVESPTTKSVPAGACVTTIFEGPVEIVAAGGRSVVSCGSAVGWLQVSSHPVAVISATGEQCLHGELFVKFGSDISW